MLKQLQQLINVLYRYPKEKIKQIKRFGGIAEYHKMKLGRKKMEAASYRLKPVESFEEGFPIYFLTGKKYLYQTLFCITSLVKTCNAKFKFILVDDGSFDKDLITRITIQLPKSIIITSKEISSNLHYYLPKNIYPTIHKKREIYPHLKKLTDIHTLLSDEWKLVLDSDMLFWSEPIALINWFTHQDNFIFMSDCGEAYGYPRPVLELICGHEIPEKINVGVAGMHSCSIDWHKIETWIKELEKNHGASYYLEQALTAMIVSNKPIKILPDENYVVGPQALHSQSSLILSHYVDLSKKRYFTSEWKKFI
jgi:hypothetical protein